MIELLLGGLAALGAVNRAQGAPRTSGQQGRVATPLSDGNTFYPSVTTQDREDPAVAPFQNLVDRLEERSQSAVNAMIARPKPIFEDVQQINRNDLIQQMNPITTVTITKREAPAPMPEPKGLRKATATIGTNDLFTRTFKPKRPTTVIIDDAQPGMQGETTTAPAVQTIETIRNMTPENIYEPPRRPATVITEKKGWRRPDITIPRREDTTGPNTTVKGVIDGMPTTPRWEPPPRPPSEIPRIHRNRPRGIIVDNELQRTPDAPDPQWVSPEVQPVVAESGGGPGAIEFESGPAPTAPIQPIPTSTTGLNILEGRVTTPAIGDLPTFDRRRAETHSALNNARASLKNSVDAVRESAANLTPKATPTAAPTDSEIDMWLRENDFMSRFY